MAIQTATPCISLGVRAEKAPPRRAAFNQKSQWMRMGKPKRVKCSMGVNLDTHGKGIGQSKGGGDEWRVESDGGDLA